MNTSCGSLDHWLYLHKTYEALSNPYTLDSVPAVAPTCHDDPVVLDEDDKNIVSALDEDNNNKHVRNIENENNEPPSQRSKMKNSTQLQMTSWVLTTSEPSLNQEYRKSVVHKIKTGKIESKTELKTGK